MPMRAVLKRLLTTSGACVPLLSLVRFFFITTRCPVRTVYLLPTATSQKAHSTNLIVRKTATA